MPVQLPNDAVSVGYKETRPFHFEQVFRSDAVGFCGTESQFVAAGHGYRYTELNPFARRTVEG